MFDYEDQIIPVKALSKLWLA